jgi:YaiO family outer membrane protein
MKRVAWLILAVVATAAQAQPGAEAQQLVGAARAAQARGEPASALVALERAAALAPDDAEILRLLGVAQGQAGRTDAALATLGRAQQIAPDDADVKLALAQVHYYRGDSRKSLQLAEEVLTAAPTNEDARDLVGRARRAVREAGARWHVDLYGSYSDFDDDSRRRWLESGLSVGLRVDEQLRVNGRVDIAERFGLTDVALEAGVDRRFGGHSSFTLAAGVTPGADFLPEWAVRGGIRTRAWQGDGGTGVGPGILTLDARYAEYRSGSVETLSPGIEQYFAGGRIWATGRLIFTWDENGDRQTGWLVRGDGQVSDQLRLFAGYADAPETSENVTLSTRTLFGGAVVDLSDSYTLRLDYARDDRERSYVRNAFTLGLGVRF